jgi:hypothetical protein
MLANEMHKPYQVICTSSKIKEGCLEDVCGWLKELQARKDETLESFKNEDVWLESAFLQERNGQYYLIYYMRAENVDRAISVFRESSLAIDHFHKQCWERFTEQHEVLAPIFHLENLDEPSVEKQLYPFHLKGIRKQNDSKQKISNRFSWALRSLPSEVLC